MAGDSGPPSGKLFRGTATFAIPYWPSAKKTRPFYRSWDCWN